jgi:hypothetical protein
MIKYNNTITNTRGDSLPNYRVQVVDSDGAIVEIYADKSGTRFTDSSGNTVNYATADDKTGKVQFYWTPATGQVLQVLDLGGDLVDATADFADGYVIGNLTGDIAQSQVTDLTADLAAKAAAADLAAASGAAQIGFLQSGTGAAERTAEDKLKDSISVKDFGAVLTGLVNDGPALQAAIDAVNAAGGGDLLIPKGVLLTNQQINMKEGVTIVGSGRKTTVIKAGASITDLFDCASVSDVGFAHLTLDPNNNTSFAAVHFVGADDLNITNVYLKNWKYGIVVQSAAATPATNIRLTDVLLDTPGTPAIYPIQISAPADALIAQNYVDGVWLTNATVVGVPGAYSSTNQHTADQFAFQGVRHFYLTNCVSRYGGENGVAISRLSRYGTITGGVIELADGHGLQLGSGFARIGVADGTTFQQDGGVQSATSTGYGSIERISGNNMTIATLSGYFEIGQTLNMYRLQVAAVPVDGGGSPLWSAGQVITQDGGGAGSGTITRIGTGANNNIIALRDVTGTFDVGNTVTANGESSTVSDYDTATSTITSIDRGGDITAVNVHSRNNGLDAAANGLVFGGFYIQQADSLNFTGCQSYDDQTPKTQDYGISISNCTNVELSGNDFGRNLTANMAISGSQTTFAASNIQKLATPRGPTALTISSGAITVTHNYHRIDTEGMAATDDLTTIHGGTDGMRVVLQCISATRDVVVKDNVGIRMPGDFTLDHTEDVIELIYDGGISAWKCIAASNNGV